MTILQYHTSFLNMQNALTNCGACTEVDSGVVNWMIIKIHGTGSTADNIKAKELPVIQACTEEQEVALIFLYSTDKSKYTPLWEELENSCLGGQNSFPSTLDVAYSRLVYWMNSVRSPTKNFGPMADGANFANHRVHSDKKQSAKDRSHIT